MGERRFEGKTVMVTGAGTGFGAEIAARPRHHHRLALEPVLAHQPVLLVACGLEQPF